MKFLIILSLIIYTLSFRLPLIMNGNSEHKILKNKLSPNVEAKTILSQKKAYGVLSTLNRKSFIKNYPYGSIVSFSLDEDGHPFFIFSDISLHTRNILANNSISLCVTEYGFCSASDSRVSITGNLIINEENNNYYKEKYLKYHPGADWINFPDFKVYSMNEIKDIAFVGGFGRALKIKVKDYKSANPDPFIFEMDYIIEYINKHYYKYLIKHLELDSLKIKNVDSKGINILSNNQVLRVSFDKMANNFDELRHEIAKLFI